MDNFEKPQEIKVIDDEVIADEVLDEVGLLVEPLQETPEPKPKKTRKPRKPMSEEHKAKLKESLAKARVASLEKRQSNKKDKEIHKIKTEEVNLEQVEKEKQEKILLKEKELEERIEKRLRMKMESEYNIRYKDDKIQFLEEQLNRQHYNKPTPTPQKKETEIKEKPSPPEVNSFSPFKHASLFNKYRKY